MIRCILFDIDDTLFPSSRFAELARRNAINAMISLGVQGKQDVLYRKLLGIIKKRGTNYNKHFDVLCKELKIKNPSRYVAAAVAAYHNTKMSISPYPEVKRALLSLRENGYTLYITTNGDAIKQWDKLIRLGVVLYFDDVFVSGELKVEKGKLFFKKVLKKLKMKPSECVVVGDREDKDIKPAKALGMKTIRMKKGKYSKIPSKADAVITDMSKILKVIKTLGSK